MPKVLHALTTDDFAAATQCCQFLERQSLPWLSTMIINSNSQGQIQWTFLVLIPEGRWWNPHYHKMVRDFVRQLGCELEVDICDIGIEGVEAVEGDCVFRVDRQK